MTKYGISYIFRLVSRLKGEVKLEPRTIVFDNFEDCLNWYRNRKDDLDPVYKEKCHTDIRIFKLIPEEISLKNIEAVL